MSKAIKRKLINVEDTISVLAEQASSSLDLFPLSKYELLIKEENDHTFPPDTAILSWRWDIGNGISKNMNEAVIKAKQASFKYLLVDHFFLDQTGRDKASDVLGFQELYKKLPIIISYGRSGFYISFVGIDEEAAPEVGLIVN